MNMFQTVLAKLRGEELVDKRVGCPDCGERRVDELIWDQHGVVKCQTCGREYVP